MASTAYGHDGAERLSTITGNTTATLGYELGSGNLSTTTTSTGNGDLVQTNHYNGTTGKLESVVTTRGATVIERDTFTYPTPGTAHADQIARKQVIRLTAGGTTETYYELYGYDDLNQLTSETRYSGTYGSTESHSILASETFSYDSLGNRTDLPSDVMNQYTQDANSHALSYDARGNLTGTWDYAYTYDELNRMVSATPANHSQCKAVYTYDAQDRRTSETLYAWNSGTVDWSTTATSVTQYVYDGQMLVAEVNGTTGKLTKSYQWNPNMPNGVGGLLAITTYDANENVTGTYRPVYDGNANIVGLINLATGSVVATYTYSAFGAFTATGSGADICNFRFGGMYWQAGAGKYYDKARDYDPVLGRFMQRDPSGEGSGYNLNAYCHNDPVNRVDPTGYYSWSEFGQDVLVYIGYKNYEVKVYSTPCTPLNNSTVVVPPSKGGNVCSGPIIGADPLTPEQRDQVAYHVEFDRRYQEGVRRSSAYDPHLAEAAIVNGILAPSGIGPPVPTYRGPIINGAPTVAGPVAGVSSANSANPTFAEMMDPAEAARYQEYWQRYAPDNVTPGTNRLDFQRISGRTGRLETSRVIYDEYGRQIYRVDFGDHLRPEAHSSPHLHEYQYGPGFDPYRELLHNLDGR